ncbi:hypothetical protein AC578_7688 [Pseudocercospora eumusae]|uniref:Uncharacterized protein n=1 Tax=Pseudocercospora eumusae TaxID=321146 RepID=A0A139HL27_9PEZI|nr:hypothetical protein AC578_7688 [Pseudocercospora eumusae]
MSPSNSSRGNKRRRDSTGTQDSKKKRGSRRVENYSSTASPCNCKGSQKCGNCNMVRLLDILNQDRLKGMPPPISDEARARRDREKRSAASSSSLPSPASMGSVGTQNGETIPSEPSSSPLRHPTAETEMEIDTPKARSRPQPADEEIDDAADDAGYDGGNEADDEGNADDEEDAKTGGTSTGPSRPGLRPKGERSIVISFEHRNGTPGRDVHRGYNNLGDKAKDTRDNNQEELRNAIGGTITSDLRTREVLKDVPEKTPIFVLDLKTKMTSETTKLYEQAAGIRNTVFEYLDKAMDSRIGKAEFARFLVCEDIVLARELLIFDQGRAHGQAKQSANTEQENYQEDDGSRKTSTVTEIQAEDPVTPAGSQSVCVNDEDSTMDNAQSHLDSDWPDQHSNVGSGATDAEAMEVDDGDRAFVLPPQARQARYPQVQARFAREDLRPPQAQHGYQPPGPNAGLMFRNQQPDAQQGHGNQYQQQSVQPHTWHPGMAFPGAGVTKSHSQGFTQTNTIEINFGIAGRAWNTQGTTYLPRQ